MAVTNRTNQYWHATLEGFTTPSPLIVDKSSADGHAVAGARYDSVRAEFDRRIVEGIEAFTRRHQVELPTLFHGVWAALFYRYGAGEEIVYGWIDGVTCTAPLPVRVKVPEDAPVARWLQDLQMRLKEAAPYFDTTLEAVHELSEFNEGIPIFRSALDLCEDEFDASQYSAINCPLVFKPEIQSNAATLHIYFDTSHFERCTMASMLGHIDRILKGILADGEACLKTLPMLTDTEHERMVYAWNRTEVEFPLDACLHHLFEQRVSEMPDEVAAIYRSEQLTYGQLNAKANQLANHLKLKGAQPGKLVAISVNRTLNMAIGLMAISKSGAGYVPLDPTYPQDRLQYMLSDTQAAILLTEAAIAADLPDDDAKVVLMDAHWDEIAQQDKQNLNVSVSALDLSYVIFTSGSTGRPKGAVLNHQGRVNNFCDFNRRYEIGRGDRLLAIASIGFDMSAYDVFGTLASGACIVISDATHGPARWAELMHEHQVTVWHSVPALLEMLVDHVESKDSSHIEYLRLVLLGGDWIPVKLPDRLKLLVPNVQAVSMGGATEVSMDSTIYDINEPSSEWKSIPYGFPMANQRTYVLDPHLNPLPIGVAGELHLGGIGVGEGYLNREELTAEKFIPNPFCEGEKIYKTGDLARFGPDGNLELLGRIDFQVKIRGYRIELGEIESTLRKHPAVKECVVLAKSAYCDKYLVAYVLPDTDYQLKSQIESNQEQIEQWESVYDAAYNEAETLSDETFNIVSWNSSYTDRPYPEEVMRTWVDSTVARIKQYHPRRVLEIGCGTGLLLLRIAPECEFYHGTDISSVALKHVTAQKEKLGLDQVRLEKRPADDFSGMEEGSYDVIVLNSIVLDFPNVGYLTDVLLGATRLLRPGGIIFIGDIRNLNTLEAFHTSVQLAKSRSSLDVASFKQHIRRNSCLEEESLHQPAYFFALRERIEAITDVRVLHKRGNNKNEMSKFRYDVVLTVRGPQEGEAETLVWLDWIRDNMTLEHVRDHLTQRDGRAVAICSIPNRRVAEEYSALDLMEHEDLPTVGGLRRRLKQASEIPAAVDPEVLWALADEFECDLEVRYSKAMDERSFDAIFKDRGAPSPPHRLDDPLAASNPYSTYANNPLQAKLDREMTFELRKFLEESLPFYMVPSTFLFLDKFPLSPNGKLNRRALPEPDALGTDLSREYIAPETALEKVLCDIWKQYLALEAVSVEDSFLNLGGNSLTATQVVSRIREIFEVEVPLRECITPTIKELAETLTDCGRASKIDVADTAEFYLQISTLSEDEV